MSTVDSTIESFITIAKRFLGVKEGSSQHAIIISLYNTSKPAGEYQMTMSDPWCAAFVGAVSGGCGLQNIIPISASCDRMLAKMLGSGGFVAHNPVKGDIAFFDWNGDGKYDDHVGIVIDVSKNEVTTIEGNKSDSVATRTFNPSSLPVIFVRPSWGAPVQSTEPISLVICKEYYSNLSWDERNEIKTFPMLQRGSTGIYVKILQDFIGLIPDGNFGPETEKRLLDYQHEKDLEVDGICGRETWSSFFV